MKECICATSRYTENALKKRSCHMFLSKLYDKNAKHKSINIIGIQTEIRPYTSKYNSRDEKNRSLFHNSIISSSIFIIKITIAIDSNVLNFTVTITINTSHSIFTPLNTSEYTYFS